MYITGGFFFLSVHACYLNDDILLFLSLSGFLLDKYFKGVGDLFQSGVFVFLPSVIVLLQVMFSSRQNNKCKTQKSRQSKKWAQGRRVRSG